ncbi:hypothetical protein Nepgr_019258 [Nepenthes gracilis]|uniref:YbaK/aminoacyl-tRNA synthetase-associated domain-containing protein n=1 Tax=Nepenthes gracilis TaxID=150966 RepID=A0AAD3SVL8_NEPGR|nr:hypothetical protein Nepgr_019258 [Nepenthes gracilis]
MGYTKEKLLARLKELQIDFTQYEHPVVLTVDEQAKYVGHLGGGLSKNLFLKDKKNRFYVVSALADTKVDLKVLSQRFGLGKGGIRMAPEEALGEILQVPLGCVTPFALLNESARRVSLLLDQSFRAHDRCFFHPLSNDMSISISAHDLDKFLKSIGRDSAYVDLEANPTVGKEQPPDLAHLVPSDAIIVPESAALTASLQVPTQNDESELMNHNPLTTTTKTDKQSKEKKIFKEKTANEVHSYRSYANPQLFVEEILDKASSLILSEITEETIKQHGDQLGAVASNSIRKRLSLELNNLAIIFKNKAYTEGFRAGTQQSAQ